MSQPSITFLAPNLKLNGAFVLASNTFSFASFPTYFTDTWYSDRWANLTKKKREKREKDLSSYCRNGTTSLLQHSDLDSSVCKRSRFTCDKQNIISEGSKQNDNEKHDKAKVYARLNEIHCCIMATAK